MDTITLSVLYCVLHYTMISLYLPFNCGYMISDAGCKIGCVLPNLSAWSGVAQAREPVVCYPEVLPVHM